jgi:arsenite methyltransferase
MSSPNLLITYDDLPLWSAPFGLTLLDTIRMKTNVNVLDIGSGSGFPMLELAARMGRTCMVYGLDPSADSIGMITAKKEAKGIERAKIIQGVAEDIPFPDEYFGLIVSNNGLNNVLDQVKALSECYRVADKEAQMVLTMNLPHTMIEFYEVFEQTLREMGLIEEISGMQAHIHDKRKPVDYLKNLILSAGFEIRSIQADGFKLKYSDGSAFLSHYFIREAFMKNWKEIIKEDIAVQFFENLEQNLNQVASEKGELVMSIPFVCFDCSRH